MGGRPGYEYSYSFWLENGIIPSYRIQIVGLFTVGWRGFLFEIRTNFKVKRIRAEDGGDGIMMMGSERLGATMREDQDRALLVWMTNFRLKDYWMSDDEIETLVRDALDFAVVQRAANPPDSPSNRLLPVVVGLDVTTVQREGEPINATIDRAVMPDRLMPLYLWDVSFPGTLEFDDTPYRRYKRFLMEVPRTRIEENDGALMNSCPVCSCHYVVGAPISFLPCNHACHPRCIFNWMEKGNSSCPLCGVHIPT